MIGYPPSAQITEILREGPPPPLYTFPNPFTESRPPVEQLHGHFGLFRGDQSQIEELILELPRDSRVALYLGRMSSLVTLVVWCRDGAEQQALSPYFMRRTGTLEPSWSDKSKLTLVTSGQCMSRLDFKPVVTLIGSVIPETSLVFEISNTLARGALGEAKQLWTSWVSRFKPPEIFQLMIPSPDAVDWALPIDTLVTLYGAIDLLSPHHQLLAGTWLTVLNADPLAGARVVTELTTNYLPVTSDPVEKTISALGCESGAEEVLSRLNWERIRFAIEERGSTAAEKRDLRWKELVHGFGRNEWSLRIPSAFHHSPGGGDMVSRKLPGPISQQLPDSPSSDPWSYARWLLARAYLERSGNGENSVRDFNAAAKRLAKEDLKDCLVGSGMGIHVAWVTRLIRSTSGGSLFGAYSYDLLDLWRTNPFEPNSEIFAAPYAFGTESVTRALSRSIEGVFERFDENRTEVSSREVWSALVAGICLPMSVRNGLHDRLISMARLAVSEKPPEEDSTSWDIAFAQIAVLATFGSPELINLVRSRAVKIEELSTAAGRSLFDRLATAIEFGLFQLAERYVDTTKPEGFDEALLALKRTVRQRAG